MFGDKGLRIIHMPRPTSWSVRAFIFQTTVLAGSALGWGLVAAKPADAQTVQLGDINITLQSTVQYNFGLRTAPVDSQIATLNADDGDRNFRSGVFQNRFSTLEQLKISDGDYGFRASAQAFLDTPYLQDSKNNSPDTFNSYGIGPRGFPSGTVAREGRDLNVLAAFVYGAENFGDQKLNWQLGRQTITWGESLFSPDGISSLQAPVDVYQAESQANPQVQNLFLPTGAASASYDFGNGLTASAYWQFEYEADILPGVGSYFSPADEIGPGAQRILAAPLNFTTESIYRAPDIRPANGLDQFGFSAHDQFGNFENGIYFVRAIPKSPGLYTDVPCCFAEGPAGLQIGKYNIVYAQPVNAFAVSSSTLLLGANVAGELSFRTNQPLTSEPSYTSADPANYNDPLYATGDVINAEVSEIYLTPPLPLMPNGMSTTAEIWINDVTSVTARKAALVPDNTSGGGAFDVELEPNWFPRSDLEIETPVSWTTAYFGKSQFDGSEAAGTGTINVGLTAIYKYNLQFGVNYKRYYGSANRQGNLDRDFFSFNITRTF